MRIIFLIISTLLNYILSTQCRDGSFCPGIETCCLTPHGVGCCPFPEANCCGDGIHCCPNGYQCYPYGGCYREKNEFLTLFKNEDVSCKSELLNPTIKVNQAHQIFEIIKCVEDLKPFFKDIKYAIENINDVESLIRLIESISTLDTHAKSIFDNCYNKFILLLLEYFN
jgi:hypothetical protein